MDPQWNMVRLAAGFFIAWAVLAAWWMGKILACLDSIARSLRAQREEER